MNKLNLLLLIAMVLFASSCEKIDIPEPKLEDPVFGFWSGQIGTSPMIMNNDSMIMSTKIIPDPELKVNTFETTFTPLGSTKPNWIFKYRDSKTMRIAADTADLFYKSQSGYLNESQIDQDGYVVTHSLINTENGNEVIWTNRENSIEGGRHLSVEVGSPNEEIKVKADIISNGKSNSIEKTYKLPRKGIDLLDVKITGNEIEFILDEASAGSPSIRYKKGTSTAQSSNKFKIETSGYYTFEITDANLEKQLILKLYLELSNGNINLPKLPLFRSSDFTYYPKLPNFSKIEIIYFDQDGNEYSTRYFEQPKPFIIREVETFHKLNLQGQKVKKLDVEFSVTLKTANGNKSLVMTGIKGDIGFAYE